MKAIETVYKGCRFRSRLEARWAVFFDALGVKWEFERQGYETPAGPYLPDFWLPDFGVHFEVKGELCSEGDRLKVNACAPIILAEGGMGSARMMLIYGGVETPFLFAAGGGKVYGVYAPLFDAERKAHVPGPELPGFISMPVFFSPDYSHVDCVPVNKATDDAKGARFEHGESGTRRRKRR